jgi:hypothetical protein
MMIMFDSGDPEEEDVDISKMTCRLGTSDGSLVQPFILRPHIAA